MTRAILFPTILTLVLPLTGCDGVLAPDFSTTLLRTEGSRFTITEDGDFVSGTIPYTYENRTGSTVYIVNCNGAFAWKLERREDGRWVGAWSPVVPACLSAPIVIEEGEVFEDRLRIAGGAFGSNVRPQFDRRDPSGTYRIVWTDAYSSFDPDGPEFGELLPLVARTSNPFELRYEVEAE